MTDSDPSALVVLSIFLFGSLNVAAGTALAMIGGADGAPSPPPRMMRAKNLKWEETK